MNIFLVAAGGALGSVLRYWVQLALNAAWFPWGTMMVNVAGSAAIGVLAGLGVAGPGRLLFVTGVLGGFTTFSAFSLDAVELYQRSILLAAAYVAASVSLSILVCAAMYSAVKS
ncbi:MAG: CrcB family protein [Rubritepida sp.]|nr:CrcB family protein [Rubritepida sp.]